MLLVASYIVIGRQAMRMVPQFRAPLEKMLEQHLHTDLQIGSFTGRMDGLSPVFVLDNVRLPGPDGTEGLRINHVALTLDVIPSILHRSLRLRELLVRGVDIHLQRADDGHLRLRGLGVLGEHKRMPLHDLLSLFYRQNRLLLDQVRLTVDWPGFPQFATSNLQAELVNSGDRHHLAVRLRTADAPRQLDFRMALTGDAYQLSDVNGRAYLHLQGNGWDRWLSPRWPWSVKPETLNGEVSAWSQISGGQLASATLNLAVDRLKLAASGGNQWLIRNVTGLARVDKRSPGYQLSLSDLSLYTNAGEWHAGEMGFFWNGARGENLKWRALARDFNVGTSRQQILALPFDMPGVSGKVRDHLKQLAPSGRVQDLYADGGPHGPDAFSVRLKDLTSQASGRIPGVSGFTGWLAGTPDDGVAVVDSQQLGLQMPRLFDRTETLSLSGPVRWHRDGKVTTLDSGRLRASNADAQGDAILSARIEPGKMPELRLLADVRQGSGKQARAYVPDNKLKPKLAEWLDKALVAGKVPRARFLYQGPVKINPARQQDRTFQMAFQVADFHLHFLDGWPDLLNLQGEVLIDGRRVQGRNLSGDLMGTHLSKASFDVPEFKPGTAPRLIVAGHLQGPTDDLTHVLHDTPLKKALPDELANWSLSNGQLNGDLLLRWPLGKDGVDPEVLTTGSLGGATLSSEKRNLTVSAINGDFSYDLTRGLEINGLKGQLFGEAVQGSVHTANRITRVAIQGTAPLDQVRQWLNADWMRPATGAVKYDATLLLPWQGQPVSLSLTSDLGGAAIDLPAPLGKSDQQKEPFHLVWQAASPQQQISFQYNNRVTGRLYLGDQGVSRGHIVLGGTLPGPVSGKDILVTGHLPQLSVEPWVDYLQKGAGGDSAFPLRKLNIRVGKLNLYDIDVDNGALTVMPAGPGWKVDLEAKTLAGSLQVPPDYVARGEQPLKLKVKRANLKLPADQGKGLDPTQIPVADVDASNLKVNGVDFGHWQMHLRPRPNGIRAASLKADWRHSSFNGHLDWLVGDDGKQHSHYVGSVSSKNLGAALKDWDVQPFIESKKARAVLDLGWPGSPFEVNYDTTHGKASLEFGESRIPETNRSTSVLRVLGVLNINTITRRLRLDFSDLYKKGLSCDSISGDLSIDGPLVTTNNLVIKSPSAEFRVRGTTNMEKETLDNTMEVTLPLSSNLYAGCLAGPAACAGIFVFDRIWGNKLEKMTTLQYRVTGTWDNPKVKETNG